jgi:transcription initiation factor TFIID TATA-box-binding protein
MEKFEIKNVFASFSLQISIDLENLSKEFPKAIYDPQISPSLEVRDDENELVFCIFHTGEVTCLGGKSIKKVKSGIQNLLKFLKKKKYIRSTHIRINFSNYVATLSLDRKVKLWKAAYFLENAEYNPPKLPWLRYKPSTPNVVFHILENGKIICTGAKNKLEINSAITFLRTKLEENKLLY